MSSIVDLIKRNAAFLLHIIVTAILCVICALFFQKYPDFLLFGNVVLLCGALYYVYRIIFKKVYADSFLKIVCIAAMMIAANELYSYRKLVSVLPILATVDQKWIIVGFVVIVLSLLLIFKLLTYVDQGAYPQGPTPVGNTPTPLPADPSKNNFYSFLWFLVAVVGICVVVAIPVVLLYLFNKYSWDKAPLNFNQLVSFLASYGLSFLVILFALIVVIITLISAAKYIYFQIMSFKKASDKDANKPYPVPIYTFSIIVVCVLLYLAWKVSGVSGNNLINAFLNADYLALPLAIIAAVVLFFLLIQIIHAIILMLSELTAEKIGKFFKDQEEVLQVWARIVAIIRSIIDIILDTAILTLDFIKFVPNFFGALRGMVLYDDDEEEKNAPPQGRPHHNQTRPIRKYRGRDNRK